jgi:hypothetical protein
METRKLYLAFRSYFPLIGAADALAVARQAAAMGAQSAPVRFDLQSATPAERERIFSPGRKGWLYWRPSEYPRERVTYNPRAGFGAAKDWKPRTGKHVRWIESTERAGLRLVGFADEIARAEGYPRSIDHTGWFTDPYGDSDGSMRGIVFRLPARDGASVYVYGYADPHNDGAALLCFDNDADSPMEAARYADSFAERHAEEEREYQVKEMAKERAAELRESAKGSRSELRQIREQLAACRKRCKNWRKSKRYSALLGAVKHRMAELRAEVAENLRRASQIDDEPWSIIQN